MELMKVTHWSSIRCPECGVLCNRKLDLQFFLVTFLGTVLSILFSIFVFIWTQSFILMILSLVLLALVVFIVDPYTVRLHKAEKRKGLLAIFGHKIID